MHDDTSHLVTVHPASINNDVHTGVGSALLGKEAAMACTVAVESVILEHYNK